MFIGEGSVHGGPDVCHRVILGKAVPGPALVVVAGLALGLGRRGVAQAVTQYCVGGIHLFAEKGGVAHPLLGGEGKRLTSAPVLLPEGREVHRFILEGF